MKGTRKPDSRRRIPRFVSLVPQSLVVFALLCPTASADFASAPATGAAIVDHGKFTNLYLFHEDFPGQTWEQHLATLHRTETRAAIDGFVRSLVASSYFLPLTEYGINPPVFLGGAPTVVDCVEAARRDKVNGAIQSNTLRSFAACQVAHDGLPSDQVNIFVSPDENVAGNNFGPDSSPAMCVPGTSTNAYHAWGLNVPNYSVIPLHPACNATLTSVARSTSHEMVEILSDPAGFGYIHESGVIGRSWPGDLIMSLSSGELGDICEPGGPMNTHGDPNIAFLPFGALSVGRYWSNIDNNCQPQFIMSRTWLSAAATPLIRFTGQVHDLSRAVSVPATDSPLAIEQMMVVVTTGSDNLNGGNGPNDNADAIITLRSGRTIPFRNINAGRGWGNGDVHAANLNLPAGVRGSDIARLDLHTNFAGDNWNVDKLVLMAAVGPAAPPPPVNTFNAIQITVATGNDNARSDTEVSASLPGERAICLKPSNNADPNSVCNNNGHAADQNGHQEWPNWSSSAQQFALSSPQARAAFSNMTIQMTTHNNGGESDDNWDIQGIKVVALPTNPSQPPVALLTVGNLDNVHRGSRACIRRLTKQAGTTVFSFTGPNSTGPCNE